MNLRVAMTLAVAGLLAAGCEFPGAGGVALDEAEQAAAEASLYPRFLILQDLEAEVPETMDAEIGAVLAALAPVLPEAPDLEAVVTREPDADGGCLAGGRLFISRGLLSWVHDRDELAAALALAATACESASGRWREREAMKLPELDENHRLMQRYRDYRVQANAPLYAQAVATGCGEGRDCHGLAAEWLAAAGFADSGPPRLHRRIRQGWPDAAWLVRFPGAPAADPGPADGVADGEAYRLVNGWREGLEWLVQVRDSIDSGELRAGYRALIQARRQLDAEWAVRMATVRLNLANLHPETSQRELRTLEAIWGEHPHGDYWWGMIWMQMRSTATGVQRLEASLEVLPRASAHYQLGRHMEFRNRPEQAVTHYRAVTQAGELHPDASSAAVRLAALERE